MKYDELLLAVNDYKKEHPNECVFVVVADADNVNSVINGKCLHLAEALTKLSIKSDFIGIAVETAAMLLAKRRVDVMETMPKSKFKFA